MLDPDATFEGGREATVVEVNIWTGVIGVRGVVAVVAKRSLALSGSRADWEDKLSTEPQLIGLVQSSSPNPLSESEIELLGLEFGDVEFTLELVEVVGKGVALPLESLNG